MMGFLEALGFEAVVLFLRRGFCLHIAVFRDTNMYGSKQRVVPDFDSRART